MAGTWAGVTVVPLVAASVEHLKIGEPIDRDEDARPRSL
jgi:hypothetical protein